MKRVKWLGQRLVDEIVWGMYLAAMFICAYVGVYAYFMGRWTYMWLGGLGWAGSWGWGLFFKYYVMAPNRQGKRRKGKKDGMVRRWIMRIDVRGRSSVR